MRDISRQTITDISKMEAFCCDRFEEYMTLYSLRRLLSCGNLPPFPRLSQLWKNWNAVEPTTFYVPTWDHLFSASIYYNDLFERHSAREFLATTVDRYLLGYVKAHYEKYLSLCKT